MCYLTLLLFNIYIFYLHILMKKFSIIKPSAVDKVLASPVDTNIVGIEYMKKNPNTHVIRTFDGSGNNLINPDYGMVDTALLRISPLAYADGISELANRSPTPREISNTICAATNGTLNSRGLTNMVWAWGQFLDHEIDLTPGSGEEANMVTPNGDEFPGRTIGFTRSVHDPREGPRQQLNTISAYIDATNVYGCRASRAYKLRSLDGSGELKTSVADNGEIVLPYNEFGMDNAESTNPSLFVAGDIRANENVLLTGLHVLFVREHNRICRDIRERYPKYSEEMIFHYARRKIIALMQHITVSEFIPALLGSDALSVYTGYNENVNPGIANEFSTAGYRLGHSMVTNTLQVGDSDSISLQEAFFNPSWVKTNGIESLIQGACNQQMHEINNEIVDELRNNLFGPPTAEHLLDLASLNIQRGRDHGLPDYNTMRVAYGLPEHTSFTQITSNVTLQNKLASTYSSINEVDPWVGGLCEDHLPGKAVGALIHAILVDQFTRLRDGDRFWWESDILFTDAEKVEIYNTRLSDIINRNTNLSVRRDVFHL